MPEWLYEDGIGEARAALVENGEILEAAIERPHTGPRQGTVARARFQGQLVGRRTALVDLTGYGEAVLSPVPAGAGQGQKLTVEVVREMIFLRHVFYEGRSFKSPKVKAVPADTPLVAGPALRERLATSGHPVRELRSLGPDELEAAGWSELIEQAISGKVEFPGGALLIQLTEGMTVIDVDGHFEPDALSIAGAQAAARAIRRMGLAGSIAIDLPSATGREARKRAAEAFDAEMSGAFERTAVSGWGLLHVIMPRRRASLMELLQGDQHIAAAMTLYRRAERDPRIGPVRITASQDVLTAFGRHAGNDAELERRRGAAVHWEIKNSLPTWSGYVHVLRDPDDLKDDDDD